MAIAPEWSENRKLALVRNDKSAMGRMIVGPVTTERHACVALTIGRLRADLVREIAAKGRDSRAVIAPEKGAVTGATAAPRVVMEGSFW